jgi:hypothetical protein
MFRARGTITSPLAVQSGDVLGRLDFVGRSPSYLYGAKASIYGYAAENWTDWAAGAYLTFVTTPTGTINGLERMRIDPNGNIGIGTMSPQSQLHIYKKVDGAIGATLSLDNDGTGAGSGYAIKYRYGATGIVGSLDYTFSAIGALDLHNKLWNGAAEQERFTIIGQTGNVGIGTTTPSAKLDVAGNTNITGNITVTGTGNINATGTITGGNIQATYQDVAEWVPATHAFAAGTVVVLNPTKSNQVMASAQAYDTRVAGVVSERPGLALGEAGTDKVLVATTGRVKVKVDATRAAIHVGDLLVTSDVEGVAMKSIPLDLGGTPIHRPGTLIGKALEPLEKGTGEILVLLSLQ